LSASSETANELQLSAVFADLPTLQTPRLILRRMTLDDAEAMFAYASDPQVTRNLAWETHRTLVDSLAFLQASLEQYRKGEVAPWGIVLVETGTLTGTIGYMDWDPRHARAEVGYAIGRRYWGRGLMTEALRAVLHFGFRRMYLNRVQALCYPENRASARVMEKVGMRYEGTIGEWIFAKGVFHDVKQYAILRADFDALEGSSLVEGRHG
jgi:ribosomal-protein-alanine N-acetyltransferase